MPSLPVVEKPVTILLLVTVYMELAGRVTLLDINVNDPVVFVVKFVKVLLFIVTFKCVAVFDRAVMAAVAATE